MLVADFEVRRRQFAVNVAIQLEPGERLAVLGRSGAGKTTFLEAVAGLVELDRGEIRLGSRLLSSAGGAHDLPVGRRGVGLLRQNPGLFPHLTVQENICYPGHSRPDVAVAMANRMGLAALLGARPQGLSGGEAQRVALCRSLQSGVGLLCLDEPFSSLDRELGRELLELVRAELEAGPTAALLVSHRLEEAQAFAGRVAILDRGALLQVGDARELVLRPLSATVAALVGYRGWLRRGDQLMAIHPDRVWASGGAEQDGALSGRVVGMRPDGVRIDAELEALGEWTGRFHCHLDDPPQMGQEIRFRVDAPPIFEGQEARLD